MTSQCGHTHIVTLKNSERWKEGREFLTTISVSLFVLLLASLYDHMYMYAGLFVHSAVVLHVFLCIMQAYSLLPGLWRDSLHVTCGLTACTPRSAPGPTLGNEYGKTLPLPLLIVRLCFMSDILFGWFTDWLQCTDLFSCLVQICLINLLSDMHLLTYLKSWVHWSNLAKRHIGRWIRVVHGSISCDPTQANPTQYS